MAELPVALRHYPYMFSTLTGAAIRIAPIQPEVVERVLITQLSLDSLFEEMKYYGMGDFL